MIKVTAHTIVKNEDIWVWFAINSVLPFVDKIYIFDTGSTDRTIEVIKSIKSDKIVLEERGVQTPKSLVELRQEQIQRTKTDWFLILDGDEIWPETQLKKLIVKVESADEKTVAAFNYSRNAIGDVFHFLPETSGKYQIGGKRGTLNIRLIRKTNDLKVMGEYPLEAYSNQDGPISKQAERLLFVDCWYLHTSFLKRSTTDYQKTSGSFGKKKIWEKGKTLIKSNLPEVFSQDHPTFILDPFKPRGYFYEVVAGLTTPIINLKRKVR